MPKEQYDAKTLDDLVLVQDEYSKYLSRLETRPNIRTKRFFKEFIEACPLIKQKQQKQSKKRASKSVEKENKKPLINEENNKAKEQQMLKQKSISKAKG